MHKLAYPLWSTGCHLRLRVHSVTATRTTAPGDRGRGGVGVGDEATSAITAAAGWVPGTTVGCGPVAVLVATLVGADVLAAAGRLCVSINRRVGVPAAGRLSPTTAGRSVGAGIVDAPMASGRGSRGGSGDGPPDLWALASASHAAVQASGRRAAEVSAFGVTPLALIPLSPGRSLDPRGGHLCLAAAQHHAAGSVQRRPLRTDRRVGGRPGGGSDFFTYVFVSGVPTSRPVSCRLVLFVQRAGWPRLRVPAASQWKRAGGRRR